jgi:Holliday junction resolvase
MSRNYERELKRILQGDIDILNNVTKTCSKEEKEAYFKIREKPFVVIRSAGSLGVDLVALRGDISFPIEVKSSKYKRIRMANNPQLKEQARKYKEICKKAGLLPIYAFRLKNYRGDSWRIFTLKDMKVSRAAGVIYRRLPKAHVSKDGYLILKWDEGMQLNEFINRLPKSSINSITSMKSSK